MEKNESGKCSYRKVETTWNMKEDIRDILKRIEERRPYVAIYNKLYKRKPQWDRDALKEDHLHFEDWLVWYKREERINDILGAD